MAVDIQADLEALYAAIIARASGKQVSQSGHKDKQASFVGTPLKDLIRLYRSMWFKESGLPDIADIERAVTRRAKPIHVAFGDSFR